MTTFKAKFQQHWFLIVAAFVAMGDLIAVKTTNWSGSAQLIEGAVLIDMALIIPALYLFCYRHNLKRAAIRAVALACLGIWASGHLIPESHQEMIGNLSWLRYLGLGVLVLLELKLVILMWRSIFSGQSREDAAKQLSRSTDMPLWAAKLMAWEANIWRRIARFFRLTNS